MGWGQGDEVYLRSPGRGEGKGRTGITHQAGARVDCFKNHQASVLSSSTVVVRLEIHASFTCMCYEDS